MFAYIDSIAPQVVFWLQPLSWPHPSGIATPLDLNPEAEVAAGVTAGKWKEGREKGRKVQTYPSEEKQKKEKVLLVGSRC